MSQSSGSLMPNIQPAGTDQRRIAEQVPVQANGGILLIGWAIRRDTVLVEASGLVSPQVIIDGQEVTPIQTHETTREMDSWLPLTAFELPAGTLEVDGEFHLLDLGPTPLPPGALGDRFSFWCRMFPRLRGC